MKAIFCKSIAGATLICMAGISANAAPLQRADVPAEPAWLLHVDCDALRPTIIGQHVLTELAKPENKDKLAAFESIFSFDLRTQLHGVTIYGASVDAHAGTMILYADFDPARLVMIAKAAKDAQSVAHGKHFIRSWLNESKKKESSPTRVYAAIVGKRVILGQREQTVADALDVMDRKIPSLATSTEFAGLGAVGDAHVVEGAARKLEVSPSGPGASFLKFSKTAELVMGETDRQFHGRLTLVANDENVASQIMSMAQAIVALMKFDKSNPQSAELVSALVIKRDGARVVATVDLPAAKVVEMMKADVARKQRQKKSDLNTQ